MALIQPTENEKFLLLRIEALEREIERLTKISEPIHRISNIDINDPIFFEPLKSEYYETRI